MLCPSPGAHIEVVVKRRGPGYSAAELMLRRVAALNARELHQGGTRCCTIGPPSIRKPVTSPSTEAVLRTTLLACWFALSWLCFSQAQAQESHGTLQRIAQSKSIRLGYLK